MQVLLLRAFRIIAAASVSDHTSGSSDVPEAMAPHPTGQALVGTSFMALEERVEHREAILKDIRLWLRQRRSGDWIPAVSSAKRALRTSKDPDSLISDESTRGGSCPPLLPPPLSLLLAL